MGVGREPLVLLVSMVVMVAWSQCGFISLIYIVRPIRPNYSY